MSPMVSAVNPEKTPENVPGKTWTGRALSRPAARIGAGLFLLLFGLGLLYATGFAGAHVLHNAAHDVRHANGFPCH